MGRELKREYPCAVCGKDVFFSEQDEKKFFVICDCGVRVEKEENLNLDKATKVGAKEKYYTQGV